MPGFLQYKQIKINKLKDKIHMIISIDAEKPFASNSLLWKAVLYTADFYKYPGALPSNPHTEVLRYL